MKRSLHVIFLCSLLLSCSKHIDLTNPKSVIENYYALKESREIELQYNLVADTCKMFATLQDYSGYYSEIDSLRSLYDYKVHKIRQMPLDPKNPKYRLYEIEYLVVKLNGSDTIKDFSYNSVLNESGKWKAIWTLNISHAARKLMKAQKFSDAIQAYREVLKYDPLNAQAYRQIGWCQYRQGYYRDALKNTQKAIELSPKDESNYNLLAGIYQNQENNELAIENYKKAIEMTHSDGQKVYLMSNLSIAYLELDKYDETRSSVNEALKIDSTYTHAWWRKGIVLKKENKRDSAIICFRKALDLKPMSDFLQHQLYSDLSYQEYLSATYASHDSNLRSEYLISAKKHILKALDLQHDNDLYKKLLDEINRIK